MKKIRISCLILCFALLLQLVPGAVTTVLATEISEGSTESTGATSTTVPPYDSSVMDSSITYGCRSIDAKVPLWGTDRLLETAGAAILYELNSDSLVYAWNPDIQVPPASLVKIMTCLLAIENCSLSENVTVTTTAIATLPKDTTLNFLIGETFTMEEMLYAMMVGGYNDAAVVIAEHVAGSQQAFVNMMNQRAKEIGCTNTHFTNANGFQNAEQLSTARDLVKILIEALQNDKFFPFFSETVYHLPASDLSAGRGLYSANYMMTTNVTAEYYDARVTGGRTGVTDARERCLIVTAESKGMKYIAIVMCAKQITDDEGKIVRFGSYEEVKELIKKGFDGNRVTQVLGEDQILTQYPVTNGENNITVGPSETMYALLPSELISTDLSYRYQDTISSMTAPVKAGEYVTTVQVWYGNVCIAQSPVVTRNSSRVNKVADGSAGIERNDEAISTALRVVAVLVGLVVIAVGIYYLVILTRKATRRAQHRRRRRSRRRTR